MKKKRITQMLQRYIFRCCICVLYSLLCSRASTPVVTSSSQVYTNSVTNYLSVTGFHARSLTNITWHVSSPGAQDKIAVYYDYYSTMDWLSAYDLNYVSPYETDVLESPPEHTDISNPSTVSDWCGIQAYVVDPSNGFYDSTILATGIDLSEEDGESWFYTSTKGQDSAIASASQAKTTGTASVDLGDVGVFQVCLFLQASPCSPVECVAVRIYQPPYDYLEVVSTNILDTVILRFNFISRNVSSHNWWWIAGGLDGTEGPADVVDGEWPGYVSELDACWFYPSKVFDVYNKPQSEPFLCSNTSTAISNLNNKAGIVGHQWGGMSLYLAVSGGSLGVISAPWDVYIFDQLTHFYMCGVDIRKSHPDPLGENTMLSKEYFQLIATPEITDVCNAPLSEVVIYLATSLRDFTFLGEPGGFVFYGGVASQADVQIDGFTKTEYTCQMRIPLAGSHTGVVSLGSGAEIANFAVDVVPSETDAQTSKVVSAIPSSVEAGDDLFIRFYANDLFLNPVGNGDAEFYGNVISLGQEEFYSDVIIENYGNGTYDAYASMGNVTGRRFLSIYLLGADNIKSHLSGSPFDIYLVGLPVCSPDNMNIVVSECGNTIARQIQYSWVGGDRENTCTGGLDLPSDATILCTYIPKHSAIGITFVVLTTLVLLTAGLAGAFLIINREHWVCKFSQPLFCHMFLSGCAVMSLTTLLLLGEPSVARCAVLPWFSQLALTFTFSCLLVKVYRAYELFRVDKGLRRIKISNKALVLMICKVCSVDVILLTIWFAIEAPHPREAVETVGIAQVSHGICYTSYSIFTILMNLYLLLVIIWASILAWLTWNFHDSIAETKPIAISIYNMFVLGLLNCVLIVFNAGEVVRDTVKALCIDIGCIIAIVLIFLPKFLMVRSGAEMISEIVAPSPSTPTAEAIKSAKRDSNIVSVNNSVGRKRMSSVTARPTMKFTSTTGRKGGTMIAGTNDKGNFGSGFGSTNENTTTPPMSPVKMELEARRASRMVNTGVAMSPPQSPGRNTFNGGSPRAQGLVRGDSVLGNKERDARNGSNGSDVGVTSTPVSNSAGVPEQQVYDAIEEISIKPNVRPILSSTGGRSSVVVPIHDDTIEETEELEEISIIDRALVSA